MKVMVISPHPDDESIGCGGAILNHKAQDHWVGVLFLTSGEQGGHGRSPETMAQVRENEAQQAARVLRLDHLEFWREPDGELKASRRLVEQLREKLKEFEIDLVYLPHAGELHPDHRAAWRLARQVCADLSIRMLSYEIWTPLSEFTEILDISPFIEAKLEAIRCHKCQCDVLRFDDAFLGLARYRGEMHSWPGGDFAEVFQEVTP